MAWAGDDHGLGALASASPYPLGWGYCLGGNQAYDPTGAKRKNRGKPDKSGLFHGQFRGAAQLILFFAMLDIFVYNAYQTHIIPTWVFLSVFLGLATVAMGVFAVFIFLKARRAMSQPDE